MIGIIKKSKQMNRTNILIQETEKLLSAGLLLIEYGRKNSGEILDDKIKEFTIWTTRTGEFISKLYPKTSQYQNQYNQFRANVPMNKLHSNNYKAILEIIGILEAIKYELENGLLDNLKKLLQADIFADFIEMCEHLLKEGYKDAAAVIIGSVLEDTLRKLAIEKGIALVNDKGKSLTMEPLNVELARSEVYNQLFKKQITSWVDLRHNAAHGHYDQYDTKQVEQMLSFVQSFVTEMMK